MPSPARAQDLRLSRAGGAAVGALVGLPWCVLEVALRPDASTAASWAAALCIGASGAGALGLLVSRIRTFRWLAFTLCASAPLLGASHLHWAIRRAWELAIFAAPERTFAQIQILVWIALAVLGLGAAFLAYVALRGRARLWRALGGVGGCVVAVVLGLQAFAFEGIDVATSISLVVLACPFVLLIGGVWPRTIALGLAVASGIALEALPARYVELQAVVVGVAVGSSLLLARLAAQRFPQLGVERRIRTLVAAGLVLGLGAITHGLIASFPSAWRARPGHGAASVLIRSGHWLTDLDRDAYGSIFAQSDCRPLSAEVNPAAHERPGNGTDDNCLAGDASSDADAWVRSAESVNAPPPPFRGDVVLYTVDALRFDDAFGPEAPAFRALAEEGVVFSRTYGTSSFTSQSLLAHLAAMLPTSIAMTWENRLNAYPSEPPGGLALLLGEQGYDTGLAGGLQKADPSIGRRGAMYFQPSVLGHGFRVAHLVHRKAPAAEVVQAARRTWAELDDSMPRLMWVHDFSLHEAPADRAHYRDALAASSRAFAQIREHIGPDAVWVLTSDHGEEFREHGGLRHARTLYDEVIRVPLVISVPGRSHRIVERTSTTKSLMPTLVAMLAPELAPPGPGPYLCLGSTECRDLPAPMALELQDVHLHGLVLGRRKIVRDLDRGLLVAFDLAADPEERTPLSPVPADLEAALVGWEEHAFGARSPEFFWPYRTPTAR